VLLTKFERELIFGFRKELVAAAIFALASVTDWLDGYLARRRGQITALGQMMDPLADKLLTSAAFISLVQIGLAPAWIVALIIGRELAVTALRSLAASRGRPFAASSLGKVKKPPLRPLNGKVGSLEESRKGSRLVNFDELGFHQASIYERDLFPIGLAVEGPLVVEEPASTTLVFPGQQISRDEYGFLHIEKAV